MKILKFFEKLSDSEKAFFTNQYLTKASKITHPRKPASTELNRVNVAVIPFGQSTDATVANSYRIVTATVQALKIAKLFDTNTETSAFGLLLDSTGKTEDANLVRPALCRVTLSQKAGTPTSKTSSRTSRTYKAKNTRSGSIPFGRTTSVATVTDKKSGATETTVAEIDYNDSRSSIETKVRGTDLGTLKASVGFKPEIWKLGKAASGTGATVTGAFAFS